MNFIKKFKKWNPSIYATILIFLIPFSYFLITKFKLNNDFWFLVNTGKLILNKGFIRIEPFTIHENLVFIPGQWLTDIIFYLIYNKFNILGMFMLEITINSLIIFLIYKSSLLISNKRNISIYITVGIDIIFLTMEILTTRPQMFDIVFFLLELLFLELYIKKNKKYIFFIPLISLLLINFHASMWLMIFVFLLPYYVEYFIKKIKKENTFKIKPIIIITILSFVFGFLNPYTIDSILYLFNSYGIEEINNFVAEMHVVTVKNGLFIYIIIFMGLLAFYINKKNNKIRYFLLFIGTTYLTLSHSKGVLFLLVVLGFILGDCFNKKEIININETKLNKLEKLIYVVLIVGFIGFSLFNIKFTYEPKLKEIADYLDKNATKDIKLFTGYNNGSYLEYRGYKCYIDPRAEVFLKKFNKKEDIFLEYYDVIIGNIEVKSFLEKYNFDYLLVETSIENLIVKELNNNENYELVLKTDEYERDYHRIYYLYKRI